MAANEKTFGGAISEARNRRWFILGKIQVSLDAGRHFPRL